MIKLANLPTTEQNPLIFKELKATIFIDGIPKKIQLSKSDTIEALIRRVSKIVSRALTDTAFDINDKVVSNLDEFILKTKQDRILYFYSCDLPSPKYSHGVDRCLIHQSVWYGENKN